jgi:hypothetical protein
MEWSGLYPTQDQMGSKGQASQNMLPWPGKGQPQHCMPHYEPVVPYMPQPMPPQPMPYPWAMPAPPAMHPSKGWADPYAMPYPIGESHRRSLNSMYELPRKGKGKGNLPRFGSESKGLSATYHGKGAREGGRRDYMSSARNASRPAARNVSPYSAAREQVAGAMYDLLEVEQIASPDSPAAEQAGATADLPVIEQVDQAQATLAHPKADSRVSSEEHGSFLEAFPDRISEILEIIGSAESS